MSTNQDNNKKSWYIIVSHILLMGKIWSFEDIANKYGKTINHVRKVLKCRVVSSLNRGRHYIIHKKYLKKKADELGFFSKHRKIFHIKGNIIDALKYTIRKSSYGLTVSYAIKKIGRENVEKILDEISQSPDYIMRTEYGTTVYLYRKKWREQLKEAIRRHKVKLGNQDKLEEEYILSITDILKTFQEFTGTIDFDIDDGTRYTLLSKLSALLMKFLKSESYRGLEIMLKMDERIRKACLLKDDDTIDYTTLCKFFRTIPLMDLEKIFVQIVKEFKCLGVIKGKFLAIDSTHIFAYVNIHKDTDKYGIEGAEWGEHQGSFYGYKIHIIIDSEAELPIAIYITGGNTHDSKALIPLVDFVKNNYDISEIIALFGDAAYDDKILIEKVEDLLKCKVFTPTNPRRSKIHKYIKKLVMDTFKKFGEKINSISDFLRYFPQKTLNSYGLNLTASRISLIVKIAEERLNRHLRVGVERVFSRIKWFTNFERPKVRIFDSIKKHVYLCFIAIMMVGLTAHKLGIPKYLFKLSNIY